MFGAQGGGCDVQEGQKTNGRLADPDRRRVPLSALLVSILALAIASFVNLVWIEQLPNYFALLWVLALIPPFLLAYYRGWEGAALALAAGMILLIGVEVGGSYLTERDVRWYILSGVITGLILVSLGAGVVTERLHKREKDALQLAYEDALTGLPNRRILDLFLGKEFAAAQRGAPLAVVALDIDGFKSFNDTQGHAAGDDALRLVGAALDTNTRAMNTSGRMGGDEFLSLLSGETAAGAYYFAERVRKTVAGATVRKEQHVTVSIGIAEYEPQMADIRGLLEAADRALYASKRLGGDRVVVNGESGLVYVKAGMLVLGSDGEVRREQGAEEEEGSEPKELVQPGAGDDTM
jgi:diguanylate cyclase (GGDEF)-like protein